MPYPTDRAKLGYAEPSGVYHSEYDITRLLYYTYFIESSFGSPSILYSGQIPIANYYRTHSYDNDSILLYGDGFMHSISSRNIYWYDYDAYQNNKLSLPSLGGSGVSVLSTGVTTFFRKYPLVWRYYDLTSSGQFTKFFTKSFGLPFSDVSLSSGERPINTTLPTLSVTGYPDRRMRYDEELIMPFYQITDVMMQCQTHIQNMYDNPKTNSVHPCSEFFEIPSNNLTLHTPAPYKIQNPHEYYTVSGVSIPQLPKEICLQLNDLTLKPTGFINLTTYKNLLNTGILPGSGFMPYIEMARQCMFDNIRDSNFVSRIYNPTPVTPISFSSVSGLGNLGYGSANLSSGVFTDIAQIVWSDKLYNSIGFGYMLAMEIPDYDILFSNLTFRVFDYRPIRIFCSGNQPSVYLDATSYRKSGSSILSETVQIKFVPVLISNLFLANDMRVPISITSSVCTLGDGSGIRHAVNIGSNTIPYNSFIINTGGSPFGVTYVYPTEFNRTYDPLIPAFQETINQKPYQNIASDPYRTTSTYMLTNWICWVPTRAIKPTGTASFGITFTELTIPSGALSLNPSSIFISVNDIAIPCSRIQNIDIKQAQTQTALSIPPIPSSLFDMFVNFQGHTDINRF